MKLEIGSIMGHKILLEENNEAGGNFYIASARLEAILKTGIQMQMINIDEAHARKSIEAELTLSLIWGILLKVKELRK